MICQQNQSVIFINSEFHGSTNIFPLSFYVCLHNYFSYTITYWTNIEYSVSAIIKPIAMSFKIIPFKSFFYYCPDIIFTYTQLINSIEITLSIKITHFRQINCVSWLYSCANITYKGNTKVFYTCHPNGIDLKYIEYHVIHFQFTNYVYWHYKSTELNFFICLDSLLTTQKLINK